MHGAFFKNINHCKARLHVLILNAMHGGGVVQKHLPNPRSPCPCPNGPNHLDLMSNKFGILLKKTHISLSLVQDAQANVMLSLRSLGPHKKDIY
jgi:hypothetical protein